MEEDFRTILAENHPASREMKRVIRDTVKNYEAAKADLEKRNTFRKGRCSEKMIDDLIACLKIDVPRKLITPELGIYIDNVYIHPAEDKNWYLQYSSRSTYYRRLSRATAEFYGFIVFISQRMAPEYHIY